ncbi:AraC family transcriptional regulator [Porphyromonas sp.]|uniref:helix-turn-helix domain-containing protein n=1 Tax=Porphyromonas sp. TaxID=1924944 RepID=UPI0026DD82A7|nr:AraC family transcriptional regulator [Porphyromonas sp.]MDO4771220.1 AraC family transcriptional regulator [Porphyromonas sp.]
MKPVDIERHWGCKHFAQTGRCCFSTKVYAKDDRVELKSEGSMMLIFVEDGAISYSLNDASVVKVDQDFILLLDKESHIIFKFYQTCRLSVFTFDEPTRLCDNYDINKLKRYAPSTMEVTILPIVSPLDLALKSTEMYYEAGLNCGVVMEAKLKEFFFLLSAFYSPEELGKFLAPLLRDEVDFKEFVINNYSKVSTVQELAQLRNMSLRVFNKTFKDTFNMPPYQWMLNQKGIQIEKKLAQKSVSFADIIEQFGFSSPSHFTVYCRRQYGMTPTQKRRELIDGDMQKKK